MKILWLIVVMALVSSAQQGNNSKASAAPERRFDIATPMTMDVGSMALSPDGRQIAYVAIQNGHHVLWVRDLDRPDSARALPAAGESPVFPFWSPDSRSIGFWHSNALQRIDPVTGLGKVVWSYSGKAFGRGAAWSEDGTILFAHTASTALLRVSESGGAATAAADLDNARQTQHIFPSVLPGGRYFLYYAIGSADGGGVFAGDLRTGNSVRLLDAESSAAVYASLGSAGSAGSAGSSGHLLFVRRGSLFAQPFNPATLKLSGQATPIAEQVPHVRAGAVAVSVSNTGLIAYRSEAGGSYFTWYDRSGKEMETVGGPFLLAYSPPTLSPDGQQVAFGREGDDGNVDVWLLDVNSRSTKRFTSHPAVDMSPIFSPDGLRIAFASGRGPAHTLHMKPTQVEATESEVLRTAWVGPQDWSSNGIIVAEKGPYEIIAVQLSTDGAPRQISVAPGSSGNPSKVSGPQVSPNGKWMAFLYAGRDINIAPFTLGSALPTPGVAVSMGGGRWPRWARNGKELFYVAPDGMLMAVPFDEATGRAGSAVRLFTPPMHSSTDGQFRSQYMVAPDGRFLVATPRQVESPIHIIENWKPSTP